MWHSRSKELPAQEKRQPCDRAGRVRVLGRGTGRPRVERRPALAGSYDSTRCARKLDYRAGRLGRRRRLE
ncbi:hypothetical protein NDU88_003083 [Pleurodeles waltl]|uniref:Uncharacterized protein n=1 Tax=Pleurodeles waltl TaxID=8319 RepID=A0AAV7WTN3_PLEWA|nr:hypothetical protein NDU88_003083 [Pleurodeles waltl]